MRKIEQHMLQALREHRDWAEANTRVTENGNVYLHGNHIARVEDDEVQVNEDTLYRWPTNTTLSRLRALGAHVHVKAGVVYLNNQPVEV